MGGGKLYIGKHPPGVECRVITDETIAQMIELLKLQPYLSDVAPYNNETIDYSLSKFADIFACYDHIVNWHLKAFGVHFDTTKPWLFNIKPLHTNDIVINNTFRERDVPPDWQILEGYLDKCVFVGFEHEYERFKKEMALNIPWHPTKSILELAQVICGSNLFIGNQSLAFALAEAMKVPRILELHHHCPSSMPLSDNARIILTEKILKKTFSIKKSNFFSRKSGDVSKRI